VTRREAAEAAGRGAEGLERRYREQTELLYHKQTQLEQLTAAKAADTLRWERELDSVRAELKEAARNRNREKLTAAAVPAWDVEGGEVVPTASLVRVHRRRTKSSSATLRPRTCGASFILVSTYPSPNPTHRAARTSDWRGTAAWAAWCAAPGG
jgi:hypothetical protein